MIDLDMLVRVMDYYGLSIRATERGLQVSPKPDPDCPLIGIIKRNRDDLLAYAREAQAINVTALERAYRRGRYDYIIQVNPSPR